MAKVPEIKLSNGAIPRLGLGLWKVTDAEQFNDSFRAAVDAGYRHFDTAQIYGNEQMLGNAWQASGVGREELFLTTKIWLKNFGYRHVHKSFGESLEKLQTDYIDLLLLHFPVTVLRKKAWKALEEIKAAGGAKHIGVSNYTIHHLQDMEKYAKVLPDINQVELHVFLQQPELVTYCRDKGIQIEAYSPLAHGKNMTDETITAIAEKHGKSYAQIMLRWCIQQDFVVLAKSVTPKRIQQNIEIFDFELDDEDMVKLAARDQDLRTCWNPTHVP